MPKRNYLRLSLLTLFLAPLITLSACDTQTSNTEVDDTAVDNKIDAVDSNTVIEQANVADSFTPAPVDWKPCTEFDFFDWFSVSSDIDDRLECGIIEIPIILNANTASELAKVNLDTSSALNQDATIVKLAVSRLPATGTSKQRIGSVIAIAGGPGQSGILPAYTETEAFIKLNTYFDIINYAPRGVYPSTPNIYCDWQMAADEIGRSCWDMTSNDLLATLGADYTVDDVDTIRQALGEPNISLIGYSYGTKIAALYAEKYPQYLRGAVLDGVMNLNETLMEASSSQTVGFQTTFERFIINCREQSNCYFADTTTTDEAEAKLATLLQTIDQNLPNDFVSTEIVVNGIQFLLYSETDWAQLNQLLLDLEDNNFKSLKKVITMANEGMDNIAGVATICADSAISGEDRMTHILKMRETDTPSTWYNYRDLKDEEYISPCYSWPINGSDIPHIPKLTEDTATLLLVSQTHDPATPYANAVAMQEYLDAILLTRDADGHTVVLKDISKDVDTKVVDYLIDPAKYKDIEDKNWVSRD